MAEIHDASNPEGQAALFGFIGIPADDRKRISNEDLITHCRAQLSGFLCTSRHTKSRYY
ncbi:hypothetical protein ACOBV8_18370 (plasmid) [Pseudoalteromonas espejiana]